jgi:hypothetical protein
MQAGKMKRLSIGDDAVKIENESLEYRHTTGR